MRSRATIRCCFLLLLSLVVAGPLAAQTTWYVDDDAIGDPGPGDPTVSDQFEDGSAAHPFDAIQEGIDAAAEGDTVLVLDGTYSGAGNALVDFSGKAVLVQSENGSAFCEIDGAGPGMGGVVFNSGEGNGSVLQGFTIHGVFGTYLDDAGAVRCNNASPTIRENVIRNNSCETAGGAGISCVDSDAVIEGNTIRNNFVFGFGGGIACVNSNPTITGNTITDNTCTHNGGGIYCDASSPLITGNTVSGNVSLNPTSGGGGIYCGNGSAPAIAGNTITGNKILEGGNGGGICCLSGSDPLILDNVISGNNKDIQGILHTFEGGGIHCADSSPVIAGNVVSENSVYAHVNNARSPRALTCYGAGIACVGTASPTIVNNFIAGNLMRGATTTSCFGGGIYCGPGTAAVIGSSTIVENSGDGVIDVFGAGIYCGSALTVVENCIVRDNKGLQIQGCDGLVTFSNVEGGYGGTGNIDADPLFVAGTDGCYALAQIAAGQPVDSPCVDAGSGPAVGVCFTGLGGTICLDGLTTRIDGLGDDGTVDMGYHHGGGVTVPCPPTVGASFSCLPGSGTLPFTTRMELVLENLFDGEERSVAASIDMTLAGGGLFENWRGGWTSLGAGAVFRMAWPQHIPLLGALAGDNRFDLAVEDVTPAPFNQPPWPPAGDTATDGCTVTGIMP